MKKILMLLAAGMLTLSALAKLPALSDEAKAKAAETAAKTAHAGKVDAYQLCKSQDKAAAHYRKTHKDMKPVATAPCADPGPFVYTPAPAPGAAPATVAAAPAAPAAPAKDAPKK